MVPLVHTNLDSASVRKVPETQMVACSIIGSSFFVTIYCKPNRQSSICVKDARLTIANGVDIVSASHHPKQPLVSIHWVRVEVKFKADLITRQAPRLV